MRAWQATVQDEAGNIVTNPSITVYKRDGVSLASIFDAAGAAKPNPFTGTLEGFAQFWAEPGVYKVVGASGPNTTAVWDANLDGLITPQEFGARGDGVTNDTASWAAFQAHPSNYKFVPAGQYLVSAAIKRFDKGCFGNGEFNDDTASWDQPKGDRERDSLIVHRNTINANSTLVSPIIKTQTETNFEVSTPPTASFKHIIGAYHEGTLNGYYDIDEDANNNFTVFGATSRNNMAGLFGSLAGLFYISDAKETEVPNVATMGATKNGCLYLQPTRRSLYSSGGYMFGCEVIFLNTSDDDLVSVPYLNNDEYNFTSWTACHKISGMSNSAPITTGIMMSGSNTARHGFYNGIVVGASMWSIDGNTQGPDGTVGINLAGWRESSGFADIGIKFRVANRHLYFREGTKTRSSHTRFMYEAGGCGVSIEGQTGNTQYLNFRSGATAAADGGPVVNDSQMLSTSGQFTMSSTAGELIFSPVSGPSFRMNSARFAPVTDNEFALGNTSARWTTVYAATGTINTSDERVKTEIKPIDDAALDAWGNVEFASYRFTDAVAEKGDGARIHFGLVAQRVMQVFSDYGLDANDYGLMCYDEWDGTPETVTKYKVEVTPAQYEQVLIRDATYKIVKDADGNDVRIEDEPAQYEDGDMISEAVYEERDSITPGIEAGSRYGIRYEEALCMEAAWHRRRADRIEARLSAIEAALA